MQSYAFLSLFRAMVGTFEIKLLLCLWVKTGGRGRRERGGGRKRENKKEERSKKEEGVWGGSTCRNMGERTLQ